MMDPDKKISFAFSKSTKRPLLFQKQPVYEKKVELVECLEGQSIKMKDEVVLINQPLVIPIKDNKRNLVDRIKDARTKYKTIANEKTEVVDNRPDSELTLDELAARELVNEAKKRLENRETNTKVFVLPIKEDKIVEGEIEPSLEDYETVPISDYGMAMLRGMGWKEGMGIGKNPTKSVPLSSAPELRPKGLGLGANKMVKAEAAKQLVVDKNGKELVLKRDTYAKIIAGAKKGHYCVVQGLDDEAGTVIVKISLNSEILTLNEFLLVPVTKEEYTRGCKILNAAKYEEFKEKQGKIAHKNENRKDEEISIKNEKNRENFTKSKKHSSQDIEQHPDSDSSSENDDRRRRQHKIKDKKSHKDKSRSPRRSSKKSSRRHKRYSSSSSDSHHENTRKTKSHNRKSSSRDRKYREKKK